MKTPPTFAPAGFRSLPPRIAVGAFLIALIGWGIFWAPAWIFSLGTGFFICAGLFEFYTLLKSRGALVYRLFGIAIGAVIPLVVHFQLGSNRSGEVLFIVLACFGLFLIQFSRKNDSRALEAIALTFFGIMYISWFLSFILKIKFMPGGSLLIAYLLVVTKASDVGAYLVGSLLGKHPLIAHISPKKSVEGTIGGVLASAAASVLFFDIVPFAATRPGLFGLGLLAGLIAQCGDLAESLIKRYCEAKDSGKWLPGFGGFLDTMDSVLFTTPLFYFYLQTLR